MIYRPFRKGDMVQAKGMRRGKTRQPDGTVGKILIAPANTAEPRAVYVEWMVPSQPGTKKSWCHDTELAPLTGA